MIRGLPVRRVVRAVELVAWSAGLLLLVFYAAARYWSENARVQALEQFNEWHAASSARHPDVDAPPQVGRVATLAFLEQPEEDARGAVLPGDRSAPRRDEVGQAATPVPGVDQSLWSPRRIREFAASAGTGEPPSAVLRIASLGLEVPVFEEETEVNLDRGAAHIDGTAPLGGAGNTGIAAHRDGFFRKLKDISFDAVIDLNVGGRVLRYGVVDISVVLPTDVYVLEATPSPSITLVTCYPFYFVGSAPQRYIVRAQLVGESTDSGGPSARTAERT